MRGSEAEHGREGEKTWLKLDNNPDTLQIDSL